MSAQSRFRANSTLNIALFDYNKYLDHYNTLKTKRLVSFVELNRFFGMKTYKIVDSMMIEIYKKRIDILYYFINSFIKLFSR